MIKLNFEIVLLYTFGCRGRQSWRDDSRPCSSLRHLPVPRYRSRRHKRRHSGAFRRPRLRLRPTSRQHHTCCRRPGRRTSCSRMWRSARAIRSASLCTCFEVAVVRLVDDPTAALWTTRALLGRSRRFHHRRRPLLLPLLLHRLWVFWYFNVSLLL